MKTAVSIPDPIFESAERLAKEMNISRSRLYSDAVAAFVETKGKARITKALNHVYGSEDSSLEPALLGIQLASLPKDEW